MSLERTLDKRRVVITFKGDD